MRALVLLFGMALFVPAAATADQYRDRLPQMCEGDNQVLCEYLGGVSMQMSICSLLAVGEITDAQYKRWSASPGLEGAWLTGFRSAEAECLSGALEESSKDPEDFPNPF